MIAAYNQLNKSKEEIYVTLRNQIKEIDKKLERLEERLIDEEIDKLYLINTLQSSLTKSRKIEKQLAKSGIGVSNLEKCIDTTMIYARQLNTMWDAGDYNKKNGCNFCSFLQSYKRRVSNQKG